jgi:hypothetical protein
MVHHLVAGHSLAKCVGLQDCFKVTIYVDVEQLQGAMMLRYEQHSQKVMHVS